MQNQPIFDIHCLFVHRLKQKSAPIYKSKLGELANDSSSPQIFQLAKELSDASDNFNNFFYSSKAKDLDTLDIKEIVKATNDYLSLVSGFIGDLLQPKTGHNHDSTEVSKVKSINDIDSDREEEDSDDDDDKEKEEKEEKEVKETDKKQEKKNKTLRYNLQFQWSTLAGSEKSIETNDALVEIGNVIFNQSIWYMGYSQFLVTKNAQEDGLNDEIRNVVYDCLLRAAGGFQYIRETIAPKLDAESKKTDFSDTFLRVLFLQAIAQAQEITIGRAFKKNTSIGLICKIAIDTSNAYQEALNLVNSIDNLWESRLEKLSVFLNYKHSIYQSLSYYLAAFEQNATHKYGEAIVSGKQAIFCLKNSKALITTCVSNTVSVESLKKPVTHLSNLYDNELARFERENKVIGYQTEPEEVTPLPEANRLAKPRVFEFPQTNPLWDEKIYSYFNYSKKLSIGDITPLAIQSPKLNSQKDDKVNNEEDSEASSSTTTTTKNNNNNSSNKQEKKSSSSGGCTIN